MDKLQNQNQGLAKNISKDLLKVSPSELHVSVQEQIDWAREEVKTYDEYETRLAAISQEKLLVIDDIEQAWIERCKTPMAATKELREVKTLDQALDTLAPSLYRIKGLRSEKFVLAYLKTWIVYLQTYLNVKTLLNEAMIDEAAETILSLYGYLTIPDVKNVFTDAKNGVYGEYYESISIHKVIQWFDDYAERRMKECEARSLSDHSYSKNESSGWSQRRRLEPLSAQEMLDIERGKDEK